MGSVLRSEEPAENFKGGGEQAAEPNRDAENAKAQGNKRALGIRQAGTQYWHCHKNQDNGDASPEVGVQSPLAGFWRGGKCKGKKPAAKYRGESECSF